MPPTLLTPPPLPPSTLAPLTATNGSSRSKPYLPTSSTTRTTSGSQPSPTSRSSSLHQKSRKRPTSSPASQRNKRSPCYIRCPSQLITDLDSGLIQVHNMTVSYKSSYVVERLAAKSFEIDCASQLTRSSVRHRQLRS